MAIDYLTSDCSRPSFSAAASGRANAPRAWLVGLYVPPAEPPKASVSLEIIELDPVWRMATLYRVGNLALRLRFPDREDSFAAPLTSRPRSPLPTIALH